MFKRFLGLARAKTILPGNYFNMRLQVDVIGQNDVNRYT